MERQRLVQLGIPSCAYLRKAELTFLRRSRKGESKNLSSQNSKLSASVALLIRGASPLAAAFGVCGQERRRLCPRGISLPLPQVLKSSALCPRVPLGSRCLTGFTGQLCPRLLPAGLADGAVIPSPADPAAEGLSLA